MGDAEFQAFPKMPRLSRDCLVTEKIDGTNAQIFISEDGEIRAGSKSRWITPADDNYGFAAWVEGNKYELFKLGPGRHFGEWWGKGIQRNYSLTERRFSLFNTSRWSDAEVRPACCGVVPILGSGLLDRPSFINQALKNLQNEGSVAAPGFMNPEGIVVFHIAGNFGFKKTLEKDEEPKSLRAA
jgi:hypothetical protein